MEGLTEGRHVMYVLPTSSGFNTERAAVVTHVWNKGTINLYIFPDGTFHLENLTPTSVQYSKDKEPGTWHWMEKA